MLNYFDSVVVFSFLLSQKLRLHVCRSRILFLAPNLFYIKKFLILEICTVQFDVICLHFIIFKVSYFIILIIKATWILLYHSYISWTKSFDVLHFFISILTFYPCDPLWPTPSPWGGINMQRKYFFSPLPSTGCFALVQTISNKFFLFYHLLLWPLNALKIVDFFILSLLVLLHICLKFLISDL